MHARIDLATAQRVGEPGPLPDLLRGMADSDLADLSFTPAVHGFQGFGYWPVMVSPPSDLDPETEIATGEIASIGEPDPVTKTVPALSGRAAKPPPPVPEEITFAQLRMAFARTPSKADPERTTKQDLTDLVVACKAGVAPGLTAQQMSDVEDLVEYGNVVLRSSSMVGVLAAMFGWTSTEVDDVFRLGATLGG